MWHYITLGRYSIPSFLKDAIPSFLEDMSLHHSWKLSFPHSWKMSFHHSWKVYHSLFSKNICHFNIPERCYSITPERYTIPPSVECIPLPHSFKMYNFSVITTIYLFTIRIFTEVQMRHIEHQQRCINKATRAWSLLALSCTCCHHDWLASGSFRRRRAFPHSGSRGAFGGIDGTGVWKWHNSFEIVNVWFLGFMVYENKIVSYRNVTVFMIVLIWAKWTDVGFLLFAKKKKKNLKPMASVQLVWISVNTSYFFIWMNPVDLAMPSNTYCAIGISVYYIISCSVNLLLLYCFVNITIVDVIIIIFTILFIIIIIIVAVYLLLL